jgi:2-keto-4-pentenoate hydratase
MEPQVIQTIADKLDAAKQSKKPIATLTDSYEGFTVDDAYQVQLTNINRELKRGHSIVGKKIGLTSKGMQQMLGVAEPDYGILLDNMIADTESPVSLKTLVQPRIEAEIAFILKKQLQGPGSRGRKRAD